jgi:DNA-binding NarL/FixJ family response regulator
MSPFKTLIVEDNVSFRQALLEILAKRFPLMSIEEAGNGEEAFQNIGLQVPDLIFMDIKLPGENGLQLTQKIKTKYPKVVVTILTSYDFPEYREAGYRYGANHFIVKGSSTNEEILSLVESIVKDSGFAANCSKKRQSFPEEGP